MQKLRICLKFYFRSCRSFLNLALILLWNYSYMLIFGGVLILMSNNNIAEHICYYYINKFLLINKIYLFVYNWIKNILKILKTILYFLTNLFNGRWKWSRLLNYQNGCNYANLLAKIKDSIAINFIKIFKAGPDVSLRGSPTVSPTTAALWISDPFLTTNPS